MSSTSPDHMPTHNTAFMAGRLAPRKMLLLVVVVAAGLIAAGAFAALSSPWMGVSFAPNAQPTGLRVQRVDADSPNTGQLTEGMVLVALQARDGQQIALSGELIMEDPDLMSYADLREFFSRQETLVNALADGSATALTATGQRMALRAIKPPWRQLSYFSTLTLYGLVSLLIALGIWVFKPGQRSAQLYALSGLSVFVNTVTLGVYGGRELALDGMLFAFLESLTHIATLCVCASLAGLFWVYPQPLGRAPVPACLLALAFVAWFADIAQIGGSARATIYLPVVAGYIAGLGFAGAQWWAARTRPLDRAVLKWCILAIFLGSLLLMGLLIIPPALGAEPLVSVVVGFAAYLILYVGIALGLLRYRLFDIERWWFRTWLWFAGGIVVIVLDLALVFGAGLAGSYALSVSLAVAGWAYFPLRQWLWQRFGRRSDVALDVALKEWVDKLFSAATEADIHSAWPALLRRTFAPLRLQSQAPSINAVMVSSDGARLQVPALTDTEHAVSLEFADNGGRLFRPEDVRVAELLFDLTNKALQAVQARESGAEVERNRIMRDLHDDLGARLLSLVYAAESESNRELARAGLDDLHALIDTTAGHPVRLAMVINACEGETRSRLVEAGIALDWKTPSALPPRELSARAAANLARILRESLSNIIRHAGASRVAICWRYQETSRLRVVVSDDGRCAEPKNWSSGSGLRTMQVRAQDIGGEVNWQCNVAGGCDMELVLPI